MMTKKESPGQVVLKKLRKKHDEGTAQWGSEGLDSEVTGYISTQNPMIDFMIGRPGIPRGSMTTIVGKEGAGKSSLLLHLIAETQRIGGLAVLADTERRLWTPRAKAMGVDVDNLLHLTPASLEELMQMVDEVIDFGQEENPDQPILIGIDSIAGTPTQRDLETSFNKSSPGGHARIMSRVTRVLIPKVARTQVALVCVNQLRTQIDFGAIGKPKLTMVAAKPLNYHARLKIGMDHAGIIGEDKQHPTGIKVRMSVIESRISPSRNNSHIINLNLLTGFNYVDSALDVLTEIGVIEASGQGGWFKYDGDSFHRADFPGVWEKHEELAAMVKAAPELWEVRPGEEV